MKDGRAHYGQYAVVTGASSGIGEEFARQLAQAGFDVVLVARNQQRLETLAAELTRQHGTDNRVVALDLLAEGAVPDLVRQTADLDVGIVVANAGISSTGPLIDNSIDAELDVLTLSGAVSLRLANHFGRNFSHRRRGAIVLISSTIAASPIPYLANYAATKAYVLALGQALNYELKRYGVDVLVVSPGPTNTPGHERVGLDLQGTPVMPPSKVVRTALNNLGKRAHVIPGFVNSSMDFTTRFLMPRWMSVRFYGWLFGRALGVGTTVSS